MSDGLNFLLRKWYEQFMADDPHHCEAYQDETSARTTAYTFEAFSNSPLIEALRKTWENLEGKASDS